MRSLLVKTVKISLCVLFVIGIIACGSEPAVEVDATVDEPQAAPTWELVGEDALSASQQAQLALGREAQGVLAEGLMGALAEAIDEGGSMSAISVCHDEALRITTEVASEKGVWLGRTSQKLRNPANIAPDWTRDVVYGETSELSILAASDGRLGVLTPIKLKAECTMCHGTAENLDEELYAGIIELYPDDQAIGFDEGDLRGWFWFEVPASS